VQEDPRSVEILKPILRGRDINRYHAKWRNLWLIATYPALKINIDEYPAIKAHLLSFGRERLEQEGLKLPGGGRSRSKTRYEWFELQSTCAYHELFAHEKLFWMDLTRNAKFSYDAGSPEMCCVNTVYFLCGEKMKLLAAYLNSSLISWYVNKTTVTSGMGTARWFASTVEAIPIPTVQETEIELVELVQERLEAVAGGLSEAIYETDAKIEWRVNQTYGLSDEEVKIIRQWSNQNDNS
jgi:hypothetical protein